jgi:hypothetical protein
MKHQTSHSIGTAKIPCLAGTGITDLSVSNRAWKERGWPYALLFILPLAIALPASWLLGPPVVHIGMLASLLVVRHRANRLRRVGLATCDYTGNPREPGFGSLLAVVALHVGACFAWVLYPPVVGCVVTVVAAIVTAQQFCCLTMMAPSGDPVAVSGYPVVGDLVAFPGKILSRHVMPWCSAQSVVGTTASNHRLDPHSAYTDDVVIGRIVAGDAKASPAKAMGLEAVSSKLLETTQDLAKALGGGYHAAENTTDQNREAVQRRFEDAQQKFAAETGLCARFHVVRFAEFGKLEGITLPGSDAKTPAKADDADGAHEEEGLPPAPDEVSEASEVADRT